MSVAKAGITAGSLLLMLEGIVPPRPAANEIRVIVMDFSTAVHDVHYTTRAALQKGAPRTEAHRRRRGGVAEVTNGRKNPR